MNLSTLQSQAVTIRDESLASANTASRIGTLFVDTLSAISELNQFRLAVADYITTLQATYIGPIGTYDTWADALTALTAMRPTTHKSGRYTIIIGGVTYPVTYIVGGVATYWQMIEGGIIVKSDGTLATRTSQYHTIVSRYYEDGQWSAWQTSAKTSDLPTPQSGVGGTNRTYIYSTGTTNDLPHNVFSGVFKCYQYGGEVRVTHKLWGSTADYNDGNYISSNIPTVNTGSNGVMHRNHFARLINTTLTATCESSRVIISYPDYASGGTKTVGIPSVNSAHAGVMTVNHLTMLLQAVNDIATIKAKLGLK